MPLFVVLFICVVTVDTGAGVGVVVFDDLDSGVADRNSAVVDVYVSVLVSCVVGIARITRVVVVVWWRCVVVVRVDIVAAVVVYAFAVVVDICVGYYVDC